nr:MAG TPA: hypothetical protein [Caudoviricetes sp.]
MALNEDGLGLGDLVGIDLAALHSTSTDEGAAALQVIDGNRLAPLLDAGEPVGVARDKVHLLAEGGILKDGKACHTAHRAGLHHGVAQSRRLDELRALQQQGIGLRGDQQPTAIRGNMGLGQLGAGVHDGVIDVGLGQGSSAVHGGAAGYQLGRSVGLHLQGQRVTGAVQTVGHQMAGHALGVKAVDDLVHGLVVVDVQIQIGGGAGIGIHAVCLVVGLDGNLSVADRNLDLTGLGAALVAVVEDGIVAGDQSRTQLCIYQSGITLLTCMCHRDLLSLLQVQFRVQGFESGFHTIALVGGRCTVLGSGGDHGHPGCTVLTKGPRIRLGSIVQCLCNVGTAVGRAFQGIQIQQSPHCLDAAALLAHDGGIQGVIEGKALGLRLHVGLQLGDLLLQACHVHAVKGFQAVLCGLELGVCVVQLGLQGRGGRLLPVDVCAVLLHDPVQLFVGDAGDLVLHVFTLHGGNSFRV